jgi:transcriptional regulator with XRE-family HTH domain
MLFAPLPTTTGNESFQGAWRRFFGAFIESGREKAGLSIEQAATLAAMTAEEWSAIEAGASLPATRQQLQSIADALHIEWALMTRIVLLCRQAWDIQ